MKRFIFSLMLLCFLLAGVAAMQGCVVEKEKPTADDYGFGNDFGRSPVVVQEDEKPKRKKPFKLW